MKGIIDVIHRLQARPNDGRKCQNGFRVFTVRNGNFYGRNLDIDYADVPEFVIKVAAKDRRYAKHRYLQAA